MSLVATSILAWRIAALAVWLLLAAGAVEIVAHILHPPHRHRVRTLK
jgi:hypothetical protein